MKDKKQIKLDDIEKKNIFHVPGDYFDQLPQQIDSKINSSGNGKQVTVINWRMISYAVAASLLLVGIAWVTLFNKADDHPSIENMLSSVSDQDLVAYLENEEVDIDEIIAGVDTVTFEEMDDFNSLMPQLNEDDLEFLIEQY